MNRQILSVVITKFFILLAGLIIIVIQARSLGVADRGLLASYLVMPLLLISLTEGGMRQAATYFLGKEGIEQSSIFGSLLIYSIIAGFFGYIACYYIIVSTLDVSIVFALTLSLILPVNVFISSIKGILLGFEDIKRFNGILLYQQYVVLFLLVISYILNIIDIKLVVYITLTSYFINLLYGLFYLSKKHSLLKLKFEKKTFLLMVKKGAVFALALFLIELNYKFDIYMLSQLSDSYNLGIYTVSSQLTNLVWQLPSAVGVVLFSLSSNQVSGNGNEFFTDKVPQALRITLAISFFTVLLLCFFSEYIVNTLFGTEYIESVAVILSLAVGIVSMVIFKVLYVVIAGAGSPSKGVIIILPCVVVNILLNYWFIPDFGAIAAGLSSSFCYFLSGLFSVIIYKYIYSVRYIDLFLINKSDLYNIYNLIQKFNSKV